MSKSKRDLLGTINALYCYTSTTFVMEPKETNSVGVRLFYGVKYDILDVYKAIFAGIEATRGKARRLHIRHPFETHLDYFGDNSTVRKYEADFRRLGYDVRTSDYQSDDFCLGDFMGFRFDEIQYWSQSILRENDFTTVAISAGRTWGHDGDAFLSVNLAGFLSLADGPVLINDKDCFQVSKKAEDELFRLQRFLNLSCDRPYWITRTFCN